MFCRRTAQLLLATLVIVPFATAQEDHLWVGPNVNMVSGTTWPDGDPFLQRQNEPSVAVSTRNPIHLMAASNDYRTVDLPGLTEGLPIADSWIGVYTSLDGGGSWTSTLLPGYPQDQTNAGLASPLHGLQAAADPVMRAGTHGMFYLSGIVFDRGDEPQSKLFVARYVDLNNDPNNPVQYIDTVEVASYSYPSTVFIDKPWLAVGLPGWNAVTRIFEVEQEGNPASPVTQTVQCGNLYLAWAEIESVGGDVVESRIMTSTSMDCGDNWSPPAPISDPGTINQGASIAVGPNSNGNVYVSWRQLSGPGAITGEFADSSEIGTCGRGGGFWKNSPDDWPLESVTLGGVTHTKAEAIEILNTPTGGDITYIVFKHLLSAKLSFPLFHPIVSPVVAEADQWLAANPLGSKPTGDAKAEGVALATELESLTEVTVGPIVCGFTTETEGTPGKASIATEDAVMVTASTNGGGSFDPPTLVRSLDPWEAFDQGTSEYSFRTTAYPTMAVDPDDRVYIAWSERGEVSLTGNGNPDPVEGDSRIMVATLSYSGSSFFEESLKPIDQPEVPGHQIQPAMTYINDRLFLVYNDFRKDHSGVFDRFVMDLLTVDQHYRHTVDVRAAVAVPGPNPDFSDYSIIEHEDPIPDELERPSTQVSKYLFMPTMQGAPAVLIFEQLEYNPPVLPMFKGGTVPFFGDYVDVAGSPPFIPDGYGGWTWNTSSSVTPTAHAVWTDNRNVVGPPDGDWTSFVPLGMGGPSIFDPNVTVPECDPQSDDVDRTRMRNQDIYTSRLTSGLHVAVPGNSRPLNDSFQRGFVVFVQNGSRDTRYFRLEILDQPPGGHASFDQFGFVDFLDVEIGPHSSVSHTVYAMSTEATASIRVSVTELDGPGGGYLLDGQQSTVLINPDPSNPGPSDPSVLEGEVHAPAVFNPAVYNPAVYNPAVFNPAVFNPAVFNPAVFNPAVFNDAVLNYNVENPAVFNPAVFNPAVYNPAVFNPAVLNMALMNPAVFNPAVLNPAVFNPAVLNPAVYNPAVFNPAVFNPAVLNPAVLNPAVFNPAVLNPAVLNPAVLNPAVLNPAVFNTTFADGSATDFNLVAENHGNTTSSYTVNFSMLEEPPGFSYQLLIYRLYFTPVVDGCTLTEAAQQELLVNDLDPDLSGNLLDRGEVSFYLDPEDYAVITLRITPDPDDPNPGDPSQYPLEDLSGAVVADAVDNDDEAVGDTQSSYDTFGLLEIVTDTLPNGNQGSPYTTSFTATRGSGSYAWNLLPGLGTLPDGLSLSAAGVITGTPTATGTFDFTVQVSDGIETAEATFSISIAPASGGPVFLVQPSSATGGEFAPMFSVLVLDDNGVPIPGITVNLSLSGGCTGASLSGGISAIADIEGVATFFAVSVDRGGHGYILNATATIPGYGLVPTVSEPFGVAGFCGTDTLATARQDHTATLLPDGRVLIVGGADNAGNVFASAELYDPSTGLYAATGSMAAAREEHTATLLPTGQVLVTGGRNTGGLPAGAELYDPSTGGFTSTDTMITPRQLHTATLLADGTALIVGGLDSSNNEVSAAELYDPATGSFTSTTGGLAEARMNHTATLLADGRVFVAGGTVLGGGTIFATAEAYDPSTDTFSTSYSMNSPRSTHAAVLLPDGTVLIAGGFDSFSTTTATAEIFDPVAGTITYTGDMSTARSRFTATLLDTGEALVVGGSAGSGGLASAEVFDATTGTFAPAGDLVDLRQSHTTTLLESGQALVTGGLGLGVVSGGELYYPLLGSTFKVVTTANDGIGSLRQAVLGANAGPSKDTIEFDIPGPGPHTISLTGPLPVLLHPVVVDGTTQPGYAGTPVIELDGSGAGEATGFEIWAGSSDVIALAINRFEADGIALYAKGQNRILGNYIGTDVTGSALLQNQGRGIYFDGSCNNTIGGTTSAHQNIIAGNVASGLILEADSDGNTIQGNWIGTNPSMDTGLGNGDPTPPAPYGRGIIVRSSDNVLIGGADPGAGNTVAYNPSGIITYQSSRARIEGNVISGSTIGTGIVIQESHGVEVFSNLIGTDATGKVAIGNNRGMIITRDSSQVVVGGPSGRNIISGNRTDGIWITTPYTPFTPLPGESYLIENNYIGTDIDGIFAIPNEGANPTYAGGIGTEGSGAVIRDNLISGNVGVGIRIYGGSENVVSGNTIGMNEARDTAVPNLASGILVELNAHDNTILNNVISGNMEYGIRVQDYSDRTIIQGNWRGTNPSYDPLLGNGERGISIWDAEDTVVGGPVPTARNVSMWNSSSGIQIYRSSETQVEGNLVSGNGGTGIIIDGGSTLTTLLSNLIGTDETGTLPIGNTLSGIYVLDGSSGTTIGGPGGRNIISANRRGVFLIGSGNVVEDNYIGTDITGTADLGNNEDGVWILGTTETVRGNLISGNGWNGVNIWGFSGNTVEDNRIGTIADGSAALPNDLAGVQVEASVGNQIVDNLISGNSGPGVLLFDYANDNTVTGNTVGLNLAGTIPVPNQVGVVVRDNSHNNTIGGPGSDSNTISGNIGAGIVVGLDPTDTGAYGNAVLRNSIFNNGGLGIDLADNGFTANDVGDIDTGPNELVNYPVINTAIDTGGATDVTGTVDSGALGGSWTVQFYSSPGGSCDGSGYGEGQTYVGEALVLNIGGGTVAFAVTLPVGLSGSELTATVTSNLLPWHSSEFSQCFSVP
jgi:parallel beta-helix repeat protein